MLQEILQMDKICRIELSHILKFSNLYIFHTWWCNLFDQVEFIVWNI